MKTTLRMKPHRRLKGQHVFEVWYGGRFIGTVTGRDGPGVRLFSKYPKQVVQQLVDPMVMEVLYDLGGPHDVDPGAITIPMRFFLAGRNFQREYPNVSDPQALDHLGALLDAGWTPPWP